jgi:hypothetical protein
MSEHARDEQTLAGAGRRQAIQDAAAVAIDHGRGFHFLIGRPLAHMLGYADDWLAGLPEGSVASLVVATGFADFAITWRADVFSGVPQASSASAFGTTGINFRARKAASEAEWLATLSCAVPTGRVSPGGGDTV